jgi:hypothetical protein
MYGYGLGEAVALQLRINNPLQRVGETPTYTLTGAPPGQTIAWTSYQNGEFTGELNSTYGQVVEPNGTAKLAAGGPWRAEDVGTWQKIATFSDGTSAIVNFQVVPASVAPSPTPSPLPTATGSNWFTDPLFSIGDIDVTPAIALIGFGVLYLVTKKR